MDEWSEEQNIALLINPVTAKVVNTEGVFFQRFFQFSITSSDPFVLITLQQVGVEGCV